jgi:transaldolase
VVAHYPYRYPRLSFDTQANIDKGQITELAGYDLLTISPSLLGELQAADETLVTSPIG